MEFIMVTVLVVAVATSRAERYNPKFAAAIKKQVCNYDHENERNNLMVEAMCGEPKDVFVELKPDGAHAQVTPSAVWVKQCKGLCLDTGTDCVATGTRMRKVPVRYLDVHTGKESCATYLVEEHTSCGCQCAKPPTDCVAPLALDPQAFKYEMESI